MDDELRALERGATDPPGRVHYAEALARVGRADEALALLLASIEDPDVRRAARRMERAPAPIERLPRVLWKHDGTKEDVSALHANGLFVAVSTHDISHTWPPYVGGDPESEEVHLLDTATGALRARLDAVVCIGLIDEVAICRRAGPDDGVIMGFDARDGRELWRTPPRSDRRHVYVSAARRELVRRTFEEPGEPTWFEALSLDEPRSQPTPHFGEPDETDRSPRGSVEIGEWRFSITEGAIVAKRAGTEAWRLPSTGLGTYWSGYIAAVGERLVGVYGRGGAVFALST